MNKETFSTTCKALGQVLVGATAHECLRSGLIEAVSLLMTRDRTTTSEEETKEDGHNQITVAAAQAYIIRLRIFIESLSVKVNEKLPFNELLSLCHDVLVSAEPSLVNSDQGSDHNRH